MHIDSLIGVRAKGRAFGDLEDRPFETHRIVLSHGTLLFKTQSPFNLYSTDFSPSRIGRSRLGKLTVVHGEITFQDGLCLFGSLGLGQAQFTDQPILESVPQSFRSEEHTSELQSRVDI